MQALGAQSGIIEMKKYLIAILFFLYQPVHAENYSIVLNQLPRPITINFPEGFKLANTQSERVSRKGLLHYYKLNSAFKGDYDEVLLKEWSSENKLPIIVVGTLSSTRNIQGKITKEKWIGLRKILIESNKNKIKDIRNEWQLRFRVHSEFLVKFTNQLSWFDADNSENSVSILSHLRGERDGILLSEFILRKLMFFDGYLVFVDIHVNSSLPNTLQDIKQWASAIEIIST